MRKSVGIYYILTCIILTLLCAGTAEAGFIGGGGGGASNMPSCTVATQPAGVTGMLIYVTDGASSTDCTTGGGANKVPCVYTGSAWAAVGQAGASTVSDAAYDATGWDGVTTDSPSKNAVRDKTEAVIATIPDKAAHYLTDQAEDSLSAEVVVSANGKSLVTAADYAAMKTLLALVIGTNVQAYDADLTTYAGITPSANVQTLLGATDFADMRTKVGLAIGTNVQAYDADLTTWGGISPTAPTFSTSATTPIIYFGAAGATVGKGTFYNATSGSITLQPTTGALGTRAITLPAETGTMCTTGSVCTGYQASGTYLTASNIDDTAYDATSWNGATTVSPSKNAIKGIIESKMPTGTDGTWGYVFSNNTTRAPTASTDETYAEGHIIKINQNGTEFATTLSPTAGQITFSGPTAARTLTIADANQTLVQKVGSGTVALGTSAIDTAACATVVQTSNVSGIATTDICDWGFNGDPTGATGYSASANGMLTIIAYPTSGYCNFKVCNNTAASITPGAITLNWAVRR